MSFLRRPLFSHRANITRGIEEFFDNITKPGETPQAGSAWKARELRLKSFDDLHRLWFVLLKERNKLYTEKAHVEPGKEMLAPHRITKVRQSMASIKQVLGERQRLQTAIYDLSQSINTDEKKKIRAEIIKLRELSGTPNVPLPENELPNEVVRVEMPIIRSDRAVDRAKWRQITKEKKKKERERGEGSCEESCRRGES